MPVVASAALHDRRGVYMFVALETSREVAVVDAYDGSQIFRLNVGRAPQGLALSADGNRLYVNNFMDRTVSVFDISTLLVEGIADVPLVATWSPVASENLSPQVLLGQAAFLRRERHAARARCATSAAPPAITTAATTAASGT